MFEVIALAFYFRKERFSVLRLKRKVARDKGVDEDTDGPHVDFFIVFAVEYLGCHVVGRAQRWGVAYLVFAELGEAEVDWPHCVVTGQHDVLRLYVTVNYSIGVTVIQSGNDLLRIFSCLLLTKCLVWLLRWGTKTTNLDERSGNISLARRLAEGRIQQWLLANNSHTKLQQ